MTCTHDTSAYNDAAHHHTAFGYRKGLAVQKMFSGRTFTDLCCDPEHSSPFLLLLLFFHKRLKLTIMNCQTMFHSKKLNSSDDTLVQTVVSCCCGVFFVSLLLLFLRGGVALTMTRKIFFSHNSGSLN